MTADITRYTNRITSEHLGAPDYVQTVSFSVQPFAEIAVALFSMPQLFDIDTAVGDQLDKVGIRVGRTRFLDVPLTGVYFAFDTVNQGFDQGIWYEPFNQLTQLVRLDDEHYRLLLKAKVLANIWDGTVPGAYAVWDTLFEGTGLTMLIQDNADMSMYFMLVGVNLTDPVIKALFTTGALDLKPDGVSLTRIVASVPGDRLFAFDMDNQYLGGFDQSCWGEVT